MPNNPPVSVAYEQMNKRNDTGYHFFMSVANKRGVVRNEMRDKRNDMGYRFFISK